MAEKIGTGSNSPDVEQGLIFQIDMLTSNKLITKSNKQGSETLPVALSKMQRKRKSVETCEKLLKISKTETVQRNKWKGPSDCSAQVWRNRLSRQAC